MKRQSLIGALIIAMLLAIPGGTAFANKKKDIRADEQQQARLIYTSLLTLNNANLTGNYTVLLDSAAPSFRALNTSYRLTRIFSRFRNSRIDIGAIVLQNPTLTKNVRVDKNGILYIEGYFPTRPMNIDFKLSYQRVAGAWRLHGISVKPVLEKVAITSSINGVTKHQ